MPHLARCFALRAIGNSLWLRFRDQRNLFSEDPECEELKEFHSILCAMKALSSWYGMESAQECRECCGGLGYSAYSSLGRLRSAQDVQITWEGDNSVLIQQTARFVLKQIQKTFKGQGISAPSLSFLKMDLDEVRSFKADFKSSEELKNQDLLLQMLEHRVNINLHKSIARLQMNAKSAEDMQEAWNNSQVLHLQELAKSYGELVIAREFSDFANVLLEKDKCTGEKVKDLFVLFCVQILQKSIGVYLEGAITRDQIQLVEGLLISLCESLGDSAVSIIDSIAPPDPLLGSAIGASDGQIYQHLIQATENAPGVYSTPNWVHEVKKSLSN